MLKMRVARATNDLPAILRFYRDGLGLQLLAHFEDHAGFDGVMLGVPGETWHLEFTLRHGHTAPRAPGPENLLVLYLPDPLHWQAAKIRMEEHGHVPVSSNNPYWDIRGVTFEDADGYKVVLENAEWPL